MDNKDAPSSGHSEKSVTGEVRKNSEKPKRYCSYCKKIISGGKLKRHILRIHKLEEDVKHAMLQQKEIQNQFFEQKRKEGIYEYNLTVLSRGSNELMRERKPKYEDQVRMCGGCNSFYSNRSFYKHRLSCCSSNPDPVKPVLLTCNDLHKDQEFVEDILKKFRQTPVGDLCRNDPLIKQVGYRHFSLRRCEKSKRDEVRKCVMSEMRELARLFLQFKSSVDANVTTEEMFTRKYLKELREAIETLSSGEDGKREKHGLKLNYNAIILRTIKSLKGLFTETSQDEKFVEIGKFHQAYIFRSHEMFSSARYQCVSRSLDKLRRPKELPAEDNVRQLKDFLSEEINRVTMHFEISDYSWLRSLIVTRLTLFNGRRGEEPSRMLLQEFTDAMDNVWLPEGDVENISDEAERYLIGQFRLAYLHGKGRKYVPVLLPEDLLKPIQILIDNRIPHGIYDGNPFVFATKHSKRHCSGWHAVKHVSDAAKVPINATKNRHRISTLYAGLHMNEAEREIFFDHMGHDPAISKENYQCPQGVQEVRVMGHLLQNFDKGIGKKQIPSEADMAGITIVKRSSSGKRLKEDIDVDSESDEENILPVRRSGSGKRLRRDLDTDSGSDEENVLPVRRSGSVNWSPADTKRLHHYFEDFFRHCCSSPHQKNEGKLPSKVEILSFLDKSTPVCLQGMGKNDAYRKTRAKLFNDRKTMRLNLKTQMKKIVDQGEQKRQRWEGVQQPADDPGFLLV